VVIEAAATLSPAAMRMRRSRERRRDGLRCLRIELRETEIDALVCRGFLKSDARNVRQEIIQALYKYLDDNLDCIS
jgi:ethanolamine utilization cobalamin adenosyltransferase